MTDPSKNQNTSRWDGDVLERDRLADFLTRSLTQQSNRNASNNSSGMTVALDSGWGTGKSFFINHWAQDLRNAGHPVVIFDAWQHDIGDEAVVALMSAIHEVLCAWIKKIDKKTQAAIKINTSISTALRGLRRAIVPTSKIIATGLIRKTTGIAVNEIFDALDTSVEDATPTEAKKATIDLVDSSLDEFFKKSLESHCTRRIAIEDFKKSICEVISLLSKKADAKLPLFVFIDEVDRCRPLYAIRLLEEIKHIFGVANICFVISTNVSQLKESVRGLYGAGFDGQGYLKRFFDHTYTLPNPSNSNYAQLLLKETALFTGRKLELGLPTYSGFYSGAKAEHAIGLIFDAFDLDLRSQKQVFSIANAVAASVPEDRKIFVLWLFFLSALRHQKPDLFRRFSDHKIDQKEFLEICSEAFNVDPDIQHNEPSHEHDVVTNNKKVKLSAVLWKYLEWSRGNLIKLREIEINIFLYPEGNLHAINEESPHQYNRREIYPPSIANYAELVKYAGLLLRNNPQHEEQ